MAYTVIMEPFKGKRVLIFQQRNWGVHIGHFLAQKLQDEGCALAALTFSPGTRKFVDMQKDVTYEMIEDQDEIMAHPVEYLGADRYSLTEICAELGVNSVWPLVQSLRNHVKSYADKYYYSFRQNVSDEDITLYIQATHKSFKKLLDDFKPDIVIAPTFVTYPHIACNLYARARGIPMLAITDTKVPGVYTFSYDYLDRKSPLIDRVRELCGETSQSKNQERARVFIQEFRGHFKNPTTLRKQKSKTLISHIRHFGSPYYHIFRWFLYAPKKNPEGTGVTADWRPPRIILRDHYTRDGYQRAADRFLYYPFEKLVRCAYFPLQFQPEASIDLSSPHFNNQLETARQVAMSMPDDYVLAVKDHPAMYGYRDPAYLRKLARTPNVKLIDYRVSSEEMLKKADIVISPSGTTLAEAAFLRKPAIQLGELGITAELPNVVRHSDFTTLSEVARAILKRDLETAEYDMRLTNFVAAAFDVGFDLPYADIWAGTRLDLLPSLWKVYRAELERIFKS